ncbi:MAG: hypothetical protein K2K55_04260, partial [Duncaniella sp.]|nr:hypothetical protein [Duncaniella sp.]
MKKYINRFALLSGCALVLTACGDNAWNDHLDGFESTEGATGTENVQTLNYTLTADDYLMISNSAANKTLAGEENAKALAAVATQGYLTDVITAQDYIPALLSNPNFPYFTLDNGSAVNVTYRFGEAIPAQVTDMAGAAKYTVTDEDYQTVWGSENDYTAAFAPSHTAAASIPELLKTKFPAAADGDYVIVNYNTSAVDPVFTAPDDPEIPEFTMSEVLGSFAVGDAVDINGVVMATSTQGPIVADAAGSVFVYAPSNNADLK